MIVDHDNRLSFREVVKGCKYWPMAVLHGDGMGIPRRRALMTVKAVRALDRLS